MKTALEQIRYERGDTVLIIDRDTVLHDHRGEVVDNRYPMVFVEVEVATTSGMRPIIPFWPRELMLVEEARP